MHTHHTANIEPHATALPQGKRMAQVRASRAEEEHLREATRVQLEKDAEVSRKKAQREEAARVEAAIEEVRVAQERRRRFSSN